MNRSNLYRIKASFFFEIKTKYHKKKRMKCLSYPTDLLVCQQQVNIYTIYKIYFCVFFCSFFTQNLYESFIHKKSVRTIFMNYWKLLYTMHTHRCIWLFLFVLKVHPIPFIYCSKKRAKYIWKNQCSLEYGVWIHFW